MENHKYQEGLTIYLVLVYGWKIIIYGQLSNLLNVSIFIFKKKKKLDTLSKDPTKKIHNSKYIYIRNHQNEDMSKRTHSQFCANFTSNQLA
jgi:hypothetical protein